MTGFNDIDNLGKMSWNFTKLSSEWEAQDWPLLKEYQGVMVASSGGLDSTVLFYLLKDFLKDKKNFNLGLIHVNFGLRGKESDDDQAFVVELAKENLTSCQTHQVTKDEIQLKDSMGVQEWARKVRYDVFCHYAQRGYAIALGHHLDDVAENALLRQSRGASVGSLAGMQKFKAPYWRPLLKVPRSALEKYASKEQITHREDSTNDKIDYSRNRIRHRVVPELETLYPGATNRIAQLAFEAQDVATFCRRQLEVELESYGQGPIPASFITDKPQGVAYAALGLMFSKVGPSGKQYSRQLFQCILDKLLDLNSINKRWSFNVTGGLIFHSSRNYIWIRRKNENPILKPADIEQTLSEFLS